MVFFLDVDMCYEVLVDPKFQLNIDENNDVLCFGISNKLALHA